MAKSLEELRPSRGKHPSSVRASRRSVSEASADDGHRQAYTEFVLLEEDLFSSKDNQVY